MKITDDRYEPKSLVDTVNLFVHLSFGRGFRGDVRKSGEIGENLDFIAKPELIGIFAPRIYPMGRFIVSDKNVVDGSRLDLFNAWNLIKAERYAELYEKTFKREVEIVLCY